MPQTRTKRARGPTTEPTDGLTYASAGVDLDTYDGFIGSIGSLLRRTHGPRVISNEGGFAGLFRLDYNEALFAQNYRDPVLVACSDGVGTKVKLAAQLGKFDTLGIDLVAMCVNDMIVQGAEPLFFLDYIAVPKLEPAMLHDLVKGISLACTRTRCALLGGETAEMPDVYPAGEFDMAGFAIGVVELKRAVDPTRVAAGDVILGLGSDGIHSNGYSLVRKIVEHARLDLTDTDSELSSPAAPTRSRQRRRMKQAQADAAPPTIGEVLLTPTRLYVRPVVSVLRAYRVKKVVTGMAHITGGGLGENVARSLPDGVDAVIDRSAWPMPSVFPFLQKHGRVAGDEMDRVFNMGIGYVMIVRPTFANAIQRRLERLGERAYVLGEIVKGKGKVKMRGRRNRA